jgi:hypothetical protein
MVGQVVDPSPQGAATTDQATVAQNIPVQPEPQRVPMMDAGMLEDRTRPALKAPTPIWLGHRLQSRDSPKASLLSERPGTPAKLNGPRDEAMHLGQAG